MLQNPNIFYFFLLAYACSLRESLTYLFSASLHNIDLLVFYKTSICSSSTQHQSTLFCSTSICSSQLCSSTSDSDLLVQGLSLSLLLFLIFLLSSCSIYYSSARPICFKGWFLSFFLWVSFSSWFGVLGWFGVFLGWCVVVCACCFWVVITHQLLQKPEYWNN